MRLAHGTHPVISGVHVAVGTSAKGVDFNAVDGDPVRLAFMVLAGSNEPESLVFALFEVERLLKTPGVYDRLVMASSAAALLDIIDAEEQPKPFEDAATGDRSVSERRMAG